MSYRDPDSGLTFASYDDYVRERTGGCTGIAASWCPVHGDCTCPRDADGEIAWHFEAGYVSFAGHRGWSETARSVVDHDPACPLHAPSSTHGDDG